MAAKEILCKVLRSDWIAPQVVRIVFEPQSRLVFRGGQFLSVYIPQNSGIKPLRRAYSFASSPEKSKMTGYELCIKVAPQGRGSQYMAHLKAGDTFRATAPYGDFTFLTPPERQACFICTGTGLAPIKAILESKEFLRDPPIKTTLLFGARGPADVLFPEELQLLKGVDLVIALTQPGGLQNVFKGRVTDFLRQAPMDWNWQSTDYYLCGNPEMIQEAERVLHEGRGVSNKFIFKEAYSPIQNAAKVIEIQKIKKAA